MKLFFQKLIIFCIPLALFSYPLDLCISNYLKKSNAYYGEFEVWNDIYQSNIDSELAIYGSSRAWVDINPKILEDSLDLKTYNFGIDGHNFELQYLRHKEFLKHNPPPKIILLTVEFSSLQKRKELYLNEQFLPYMLWNNNIHQFTKSYNGFDPVDYKIPLIRYIGRPSVLKKAFGQAFSKSIPAPFRTKGYKGINKVWSNELENAKSKLGSYQIQTDASVLVLFERFLKECNDNSIKVILIYTPEYIEGQKFIKNRQEFISKLNNYSKEYNIRFLDYSLDSICFDKKYFYNATHLNKMGSELFSRNLAKDLEEFDLR